MKISEKTIERLLRYRTIAYELHIIGKEYIKSKTLAELTLTTPELVRRDFLHIKIKGNQKKGYKIKELIDKIDVLLKNRTVKAGVVGAGRLGTSVISFFRHYPNNYEIIAAFDIDPFKIGHSIDGCKIYRITELASVIEKENIEIVILTVPNKSAQFVAELLNQTKIKGILNLTGFPIKVKDDIIVNTLDITLELEKLNFFITNKANETIGKANKN